MLTKNYKIYNIEDENTKDNTIIDEIQLNFKKENNDDVDCIYQIYPIKTMENYKNDNIVNTKDTTR